MVTLQALSVGCMGFGNCILSSGEMGGHGWEKGETGREKGEERKTHSKRGNERRSGKRGGKREKDDERKEKRVGSRKIVSACLSTLVWII